MWVGGRNPFGPSGSLTPSFDLELAVAEHRRLLQKVRCIQKDGMPEGNCVLSPSMLSQSSNKGGLGGKGTAERLGNEIPNKDG